MNTQFQSEEQMDELVSVQGHTRALSTATYGICIRQIRRFGTTNQGALFILIAQELERLSSVSHNVPKATPHQTTHRSSWFHLWLVLYSTVSLPSNGWLFTSAVRRCIQKIMSHDKHVTRSTSLPVLDNGCASTCQTITLTTSRFTWKGKEQKMLRKAD